MDKLVLLCTIGIVLSFLSLIAIGKEIKAKELSIDGIGSRNVGDLVWLRGRVQGISAKNGNYFVNLCQRKCIGIRIFRETQERMRDRSTDLEDLKNGDIVAVEGIIGSNGREYSLSLLDENSLQVERK